jgi:hypothetical protein
MEMFSLHDLSPAQAEVWANRQPATAESWGAASWGTLSMDLKDLARPILY